MALNYKTYYAIPHLPTYADAKKHYDNVAPIRRDPNNTRPVGRRDQKWFHIWMEKDTVCLGYGWSPDSRQPLVSYEPGGTITLYKRNRWVSASDNERRQRLLGVDVRTHQYDTWIKCAWYDEGVLKKGHLPLRCNGVRDWKHEPERSVFTRAPDGTLLFLNYSYPTTHKLDSPKLKERLAAYGGFITFVDAVRRLQGTKRLNFSDETHAEFFGWSDKRSYRNEPVPNQAPNLFYGTECTAHLNKFLEWARSDDHDSQMRAALTLAQNNRYTAIVETRQFFIDLILKEHADDLLVPHTHKDGKLVTDRYRRYKFTNR